MIRVCVYPAQNECAVEINNALSCCEEIEVFGVTSVRGHNEYNFKNYYYEMVDIEDKNFDIEFGKFLEKNKIDVVFPTTDNTVLYFATHKNKFSAKFVNCDEKTAIIANDKRKTYELFKDCDFCPKVYSSFDYFPCFVKPKDGEGSKGIKVINSEVDIPLNFNYDSNLILEYLTGKEITVDCISDCNGNLVGVFPRYRNKIFAGMCVEGTTLDATDEIKNIAKTINEKLKINGLWFFQLKEDVNGKLKLLEISLRCAGTMCETRARGYNLPLLSVYTSLNKNIEIINNDYSVKLDRTLFARYKTDVSFDTVYVDYDGTIIVKGKVFLPVIRFLFQCKNEGKKIVLLSRHNFDHENTLGEDFVLHGISASLFDKIFNLSFEEEKSSFIKDSKAIFIDNSYFERKKVYEKKKINVFGVDSIDCLQDWKL